MDTSSPASVNSSTKRDQATAARAQYTLGELVLFVAVAAALLGLFAARRQLMQEASTDKEDAIAAAVAGGCLGLLVGLWMGCRRRPRLFNGIRGALVGPAAGALIATGTVPGMQVLCWALNAVLIVALALLLRRASGRRTSGPTAAGAAPGLHREGIARASK